MEGDLFGSGLSSLSDNEHNEISETFGESNISSTNKIFDQTTEFDDVSLTPIADEIYEEMPFFDVDMGKSLFLTKLPNFISVESSAFDPDTYAHESFQDEFMDDEGRVRLKLKIENTIRHRTQIKDNGETFNESNTRVVEWSDGSRTLHVGSEVFDVIQTSLPPMTNQLFVKTGSGLVCQGVIDHKLSFRPHSTSSDTHKRVTISVADRLSRIQKICVLPTSYVDPEKQKNERVKLEDERLRKEMRDSFKSRTKRETNVQTENLDSLYEAEIEELEKKLKNYNEDDDDGYPIPLISDIFSEDSDLSAPGKLDLDNNTTPKSKKPLKVIFDDSEED
ncbi:hypothetical protein MXB_516 [Myxobolus squamalis]|nr:hypothetical protein MXB_516 [Myxobolus squamalis]